MSAKVALALISRGRGYTAILADVGAGVSPDVARGILPCPGRNWDRITDRTNGSFTLHGMGNGTGTGTRNGTIGLLILCCTVHTVGGPGVGTGLGKCTMGCGPIFPYLICVPVMHFNHFQLLC